MKIVAFSHYADKCMSCSKLTVIEAKTIKCTY